MRTTSNPSLKLLNKEQISQVKDKIIKIGYNDDSKHYTQKESHAHTEKTSAVLENMVQQEFTFKVTKLARAQRNTLSKMIEEAYHLRGFLLRRMSKGENPLNLKPWLISYYSIPNGNVEIYKNIYYLDVNMIGYILDDIRRLYNLVEENQFSNKIYLGLNTSEHKCLTLNQYGFSHSFIASDIMRVMGISHPFHLLWTEKLEAIPSIKYGPIKIRQVHDNFYITISCMVPASARQPRRKHSTNTSQPLQQSLNQIPLKYYEDFVIQSSDNSSQQKRQA